MTRVFVTAVQVALDATLSLLIRANFVSQINAAIACANEVMARLVLLRRQAAPSTGGIDWRERYARAQSRTALI